MTTTFGGFLNGIVQWVEKEIPALAPAAEADLAAAKAHLQPVIDQVTKEAETDAAHLASVVQADGLKIIASAAAAFQTGSIDDAMKAALVGLQAAGKDVSNLSAQALQHAVVAAQAALPKAPQ